MWVDLRQISQPERPVKLDSKGEVSTSSYREGIESGAVVQVRTDLGNVILRGFGLGVDRVESGTAQVVDREEGTEGSEDETDKWVFKCFGRRFRERN